MNSPKIDSIVDGRRVRHHVVSEFLICQKASRDKEDGKLEKKVTGSCCLLYRRLSKGAWYLSFIWHPNEELCGLSRYGSVYIGQSDVKSHASVANFRTANKADRKKSAWPHNDLARFSDHHMHTEHGPRSNGHNVRTCKKTKKSRN